MQSMRTCRRMLNVKKQFVISGGRGVTLYIIPNILCGNFSAVCILKINKMLSLHLNRTRLKFSSFAINKLGFFKLSRCEHACENG